jgi:hypothetical protein
MYEFIWNVAPGVTDEILVAGCDEDFGMDIFQSTLKGSSA